MNTSWLDRNRHLIFIAILIIALGGATLFYLRQPSSGAVEVLPAQATPILTPTPMPTPTPAIVRVYVTGAVVNSDVYVLPRGSIVKDAILAAGGFTPDADPEQINQALELQDQQQIHVPRQGQIVAPPVVQGGPGQAPAVGGNRATPVLNGPLNINTATAEQLESLPGIGPAMARRIVEYREQKGRFQTIEQITEVSGIGEATFAKIKDMIAAQ